MDAKLFYYSHTEEYIGHVNLMSNICVDGSFSDSDELSAVVRKTCEKTDTEVKPSCEVIGKCALGEKCCQLSQFKSVSRLEWETLSLDDGFWGFDAITYNSNPNVEYLLAKISWTFSDIKAYDASNCSVREVLWINFFHLNKLESINLANNQISALIGELFDRMPLKVLNLCNYDFYFKNLLLKVFVSSS